LQQQQQQQQQPLNPRQGCSTPSKGAAKAVEKGTSNKAGGAPLSSISDKENVQGHSDLANRQANANLGW